MHSPDPITATAKVFTTGRSQAVRLPKAFRFATAEVTIERQGDALVLRPKPSQEAWGEGLRAALDALDLEFELARSEDWPDAEREAVQP